MSWLRHVAPALLVAPLAALAAPEMPGRDWTAPEAHVTSLRVMEAATAYRWDEPLAKVAEAPGERRTRVGVVRPAPKALADPGWQAVAGGWVARFDVASAGAMGLRARLDLDRAGALEVRVRDAPGAWRP